MEIISQVHCKLLQLSLKRAIQLSALLLVAHSYADDSTVIGSHVMQGAGRASINQAAGDFNIQSNSHALGQRTSIQTINYNQLPQPTSLSEFNKQLTAVIDSQAFAQFQGLASINQVSGEQNIQANIGSIAMDSTLETIIGQGLNDEALTQVSSQLAPSSYQLSHYQADIAPDSFLDAQGVMQINQISGDNNVAINQFSLQLPSGN
ncbi:MULTISPECIES: hypothetical protein [unclassified Shewanella]|jgi:hypothetical protein|uniref:hypothetical protein n=1 Tax=unclassified Shewanella TaxID=196818 RepID=UPI000C344757|nr:MULTISPECIES: hypothetical protein [unclassified Shewanella]MBB1361203.1 hypothetical protein [Shewanella sp. SR44-4]MBO1896366.1 hypothetical protein [Shewanella sp. BF02_Schw]PKH33832.1 hypothetical protein CXF88_07080 [Shewanella sp. ALD9]QHS12155.1 hypothetical protein GUY17_02985 [Shewanella sp. Arc9-LZ]|tara:strand:+ start:3096 stop:3713 length:618 start_codon:yes stop_codon:yes gene_type:complete